MLYQAYQAQSDLLAPWRAFADLTRTALGETSAGPAANYIFKSMAAGAEIFSRAHLIHERPAYDIETANVEGQDVPVREEAVLETPFGTLLHFRKETDVAQPRLLIVAPMAGHFPTLLRDTVRTMLDEHDVYITDWKSARDIPIAAGRFGTDEYIEHLIRFIGIIGEGAHVMAVCQPCAALLSAVAVMAEAGDPATPASMTLMAGPIDTRINPTKVNEVATAHPISWFADNLISAVPRRYFGANRRVYPGFLQVSGFLSMNLPRHIRAHMDMFGHILKGEDEKADASRKFYDEYFSVADLPAEFYLETVQKVFQENHLARGIFEYRGARVNPAAIRHTALLTVEGERDDICSVGQTQAAHTLCTGIASSAKTQYVQPGAGHYGVFSGTRWHTQVYPVVLGAIAASERQKIT
ncbi:MAG TPA: polyhydroxyalkanoate depolymerase [Rhizomicrobium sp.]